MRYIFISDVHGEYKKMLSALAAAKFCASTDTLVTLGDLFDRGPQSKEVLEYVMRLPYHICIWGNHDCRLKNLLLNYDTDNRYDIQNGLLETLQSFCGNLHLNSIWVGTTMLQEQPICKLLWQYFDECKKAIEFSDLIGVHGWIPFHQKLSGGGYTFDGNWRNAPKYIWEEDAYWADTPRLIRNKIFPDKDMIVGHWHAWRLAIEFGQEDRLKEKDLDRFERDRNFIPSLDCSMYKLQTPTIKIICIDGCSNYSTGVVNTYIYETTETPKLY